MLSSELMTGSIMLYQQVLPSICIQMV